MFKIPIPACKAVTSIGECLNYLFDSDYSKQRLMPLFQRVYRALDIGGVFIFDIAEPGQIGADIVRGFSEGGDWVVLAEKQEDRGRERLRRRITSFRKVGKHYRRAEEVHHLQLYAAADIVKQLRTVGFSVQTTRSYGSFSLPRAHVAFVAHKPVC
jgi:hypothetical protein